MERSLHSLQKSSAFLRRIFLVLLVIATAFLLWMAAAWIFGLFCTSGQMQAFETSYGGWSISAGPFVMQIQGGYFARMHSWKQWQKRHIRSKAAWI